MRFVDLAGQERALGALGRALRAGRVPHAYLFEGPQGIGKRSAAIGLGMALACVRTPRRADEACGACEACERIAHGNHPDVRVFAALGTQILKEQIDEIVRLAATRPHEAPARVTVLDDADCMNPAAQNALLKTLEEPAPRNHLVVVTAAPERLLPTIRSRTQRVRFAPVRAEELVRLAVARGLPAARAEVAAALAGGSVARLLALLGGDAEAELWSSVKRLRAAAAAREMGERFDAAAALGEKEAKETLPEALALLGRLYRDALASAVGADELVLLRERQAEVSALASLPGASRRLRRALAAVVAAEEALGANVNAVAALERLMLDLGACEARTSR